MKYFAAVVIFVSRNDGRFWNTVTFFAQFFIAIRTWGDNLSPRWTRSGRFHNRMQSRRASGRMFLYTQLLFLDTLHANSRS
jgi:hypothetical protein